MNNFDKYNNLLQKNLLKEPINVLIGGYIGTGKSTFATQIHKQLPYANILPTGIIRSVLQSVADRKAFGELFYHTFDLHKNHPKENMFVSSKRGYRRQSELVMNAINKILQFSKSEGQQFIIEGNHIFPDKSDLSNVIVIYFKTSDINKYYELISGPTHQRNFDETQLTIINHLQSFVIEYAKRHNFPVFEYDESSHALEYINKELGERLARKTFVAV
jgi:2-phosphoglycerate kinase